jgi:hypothetical protein
MAKRKEREENETSIGTSNIDSQTLFFAKANLGASL